MLSDDEKQIKPPFKLAEPKQDSVKDVADPQDDSVYDVVDRALANANHRGVNFPVQWKFQDQTHQYLTDEVLTSPFKKTEKTPGFMETVGHSIAEVNDFFIGAKGISNARNMNVVLNDPIPEGWTPTKGLANYSDLKPKYLATLLDSTGPRDMERRAFRLRERQAEEAYYSNGSLMASLIGGGLGFATSPSTYLFLGIEAKFPSIAKATMTAAERSLMHVTSASIANEAWKQSNITGGNVHDFAIDTFRDVALATAFIYGGKGLSKTYNAAKLWDARKFVNHTFNGADIKPFLNEEGTPTGYKVSPMEGSTLSSAYIKKVQVWADNQFEQKGLFGVPIIGRVIGKGAAKFNPILRMLNSRFTIISAFGNRSAEHGFLTKGTEKGIARPDTYEGKWMSHTAMNKNLSLIAKGFYYERNGIDSSGDFADSKHIVNKIVKKDLHVTQKQFNKEVIDAVLNDDSDVHPAVNGMAGLIRNELDIAWKKYLTMKGAPYSIMPPKTAKAYLNRMFDNKSILQNPKEWNQMFVDWYIEAASIEKRHMKPITMAKAALKKHKSNHNKMIKIGKASDKKMRASQLKIESLQRRLKAAEENLQNKLHEDEDLHIHVDDFHALSAKEAGDMVNLLKPLHEAEKLRDTTKAEYESKLSVLEHTKTLHKETKGKAKKEKYKTIIDDLEPKVKELKIQLIEHSHDAYLEDIKIQDMAEAGEINPRLFTFDKETHRAEFKDPDKRLKFGKIPKTKQAMIDQAQAYKHTILNQTPEDILDRIAGKISNPDSTSPLMRRTMMIPDDRLYGGQNNGTSFMHMDPMANLINYRNTLARPRYIMESLSDQIEGNSVHEIQDNMAKILAEQRDTQETEILNQKLSPKKQAKELHKLNKDFDQAQDDMEHMFNKMLGKVTGNRKFMEWQRRNLLLAATTKLMGVPLTMIADLAGITFKHGIFKSVRDGILPMLKTFNGKLKTEQAEFYRQICAHANLALNHVNSAYTSRMMGHDYIPYVPTSNMFDNGLEHVAHLSGNIYGTNYVENWLQRVTASVIQSHIIGSMIDHQKGVLKKKDLNKLLNMGLDPEEWSERFVNGWKSAGEEGNGVGGYMSKYWDWENDPEAMQKFADALTRSTKDTVIRRGMFDSPFALDNPFLANLFMFTGFLFSSITRYSIPLMQNPDIEKLLGASLMMLAGSLVQPMRRIARGEDAYTDEDNMWRMAIEDSNIFSFITPILETLNILSDDHILSNRNDKYKDRSKFGAMFGPNGSTISDLASILDHGLSGNFSQQDLKRTAKTAGLTYPLYLQALENHLISTTNLPETDREARTQ